MAKKPAHVDYETEYWCGECGIKVKRGEEVYVNDGRPRCPNGFCHCTMPFREEDYGKSASLG